MKQTIPDITTHAQRHYRLAGAHAVAAETGQTACDVPLVQAEARGRLIELEFKLVEALRECCQAIGYAHENMTAEEIDEHWQDQNLRDARAKALAVLASVEPPLIWGQAKASPIPERALPRLMAAVDKLGQSQK